MQIDFEIKIISTNVIQVRKIENALARQAVQ